MIATCCFLCVLSHCLPDRRTYGNGGRQMFSRNYGRKMAQFGKCDAVRKPCALNRGVAAILRRLPRNSASEWRHSIKGYFPFDATGRVRGDGMGQRYYHLQRHSRRQNLEAGLKGFPCAGAFKSAPKSRKSGIDLSNGICALLAIRPRSARLRPKLTASTRVAASR
jgi:hypothetical protein